MGQQKHIRPAATAIKRSSLTGSGVLLSLTAIIYSSYYLSSAPLDVSQPESSRRRFILDGRAIIVMAARLFIYVRKTRLIYSVQ